MIAQIRAGEWTFVYNPLCGMCCTAVRKDLHLWVGNGGFFLDIRIMRSSDADQNAFGLILRHYVWWAAARKATSEANRKFRGEDALENPPLDLGK